MRPPGLIVNWLINSYFCIARNATTWCNYSIFVISHEAMRTSASFRLLFLREVISWLLLQIPFSFSPPPLLLLLQLSLPILQTSRIINNLLIHGMMEHLENEDDIFVIEKSFYRFRCKWHLAIGQWLSVRSQTLCKSMMWPWLSFSIADKYQVTMGGVFWAMSHNLYVYWTGFAKLVWNGEKWNERQYQNVMYVHLTKLTIDKYILILVSHCWAGLRTLVP